MGGTKRDLQMNELILEVIEDAKNFKYGDRYLTVGIFQRNTVTDEKILIKQETFWLPKVEQE